MKKVGIVSKYRSLNYGALLQCHAMCAALEKLGFVGEQLRFNRIAPPAKGRAIWEWLRFWIYRFSWLRTLGSRLLYWRFPRDKYFQQFYKSIPHSRRYYGTPQAIRDAGRQYDAFLAGSDQVWNPGTLTGVSRTVYGLHFVDSAKRKLSYAASIGAEEAAAGKQDMYQEILDGLDFISVREKSAQQFLQPLTDKPVTVVLDPTLLLAEREWDKLAIGPGGDQPHMFAYFLDERDNRHDAQLHQIANALGLPLRCIADEPGRYPRSGTSDKQILDADPREFLGEIRDAEMVFVNSFHGLVFSILFHKPFWAFKRNRDDDRGSMNNRITDFLAEFGLSDRLLENGEVPSLEKLRTPIDYDAVDRILEEKRAFSLNWLKTALEGI